MTRDDAVERFSEAYDGTLGPAERQAFDALLAEDEVLRAEYEEFCEVLQAASWVGLDEHEEDDDAAAPDLLAGVQEKLHRRSRGRYYRDRFSREGHRGSATLTLALAAAMAVIVALAWVMLTYVRLEATPDASPPTSETAPP